MSYVAAKAISSADVSLAVRQGDAGDTAVVCGPAAAGSGRPPGGDDALPARGPRFERGDMFVGGIDVPGIACCDPTVRGTGPDR